MTPGRPRDPDVDRKIAYPGKERLAGCQPAKKTRADTEQRRAGMF
jgi:hypothetical protein